MDSGPSTIFTGKMITLLIVAAILIILSATFSASESAFFSINKLRLRLLKNKGNKKAIKAAKLLDNKEKLLNTILVGNEIVNIALSAIITSVCLELFGQSGLGYATLGVTVVLLIFGEIMPKTIATHYPERLAFFFTPFIQFVSIIVNPIVFILTKCCRFIAKIFRIKIEDKKVSFTEEDIKQYIQVSEEEGVLDNGEKEMMNRVFKFTDLSAYDIMTSRTKIKAVPINITYSQMMEVYQKTKFSHFPVYGKDLDDIKGILYMKDVLFSMSDDKTFSVKNLMRSPLFILETKKMSSIQQMLDENHESVAIVVDEYSGTHGMLTKRDIAEEIFGKISDEFDTVNSPDIVLISDEEIELEGNVRLDELNENFKLNLQSENYETINGFLMELYDGFPSVGTELAYLNYEFKIIDATERKINKVLLKIHAETEEGSL